jgi:hypothetical protein
VVEGYGPARVVPAGLGLIAAGLVALAQLTPDSPVVAAYAFLVPMALGIACTGTPLTTLLMAAVPAGRAGVGSAMNDTSRELGGALGVAVLGSIVTSRFGAALAPATADLPAAARDAAGTGLAGALGVARDRPAAASADLVDAARDAFVSGLSVAALMAAVVAAGAAAAAAALLPRRPAAELAAELATEPATGAPAEVVELPLDDPGPALARDRAS